MQTSLLNFVSSKGENEENENEDSKSHQITGGWLLRAKFPGLVNLSKAAQNSILA
jgi:hypothetical protein